LDPRPPKPCNCDAAELQSILDELYKATDRIPDGTAGAIRHTARTGELVGGSDHEQEGFELFVKLKRCSQSNFLSAYSRAWAADEAQKLGDALKELEGSDYMKKKNAGPSPGLSIVVRPPHLPSPAKVGAAVGLSGAAGVAVGVLIEAGGAAAAA
jgi:hypothetical protein